MQSMTPEIKKVSISDTTVIMEAREVQETKNRELPGLGVVHQNLTVRMVVQLPMEMAIDLSINRIQELLLIMTTMVHNLDEAP